MKARECLVGIVMSAIAASPAIGQQVKPIALTPSVNSYLSEISKATGVTITPMYGNQRAQTGCADNFTYSLTGPTVLDGVERSALYDQLSEIAGDASKACAPYQTGALAKTP